MFGAQSATPEAPVTVHDTASLYGLKYVSYAGRRKGGGESETMHHRQVRR